MRYQYMYFNNCFSKRFLEPPLFASKSSRRLGLRLYTNEYLYRVKYERERDGHSPKQFQTNWAVNQPTCCSLQLVPRRIFAINRTSAEINNSVRTAKLKLLIDNARRPRAIVPNLSVETVQQLALRSREQPNTGNFFYLLQVNHLWASCSSASFSLCYVDMAHFHRHYYSGVLLMGSLGLTPLNSSLI